MSSRRGQASRSSSLRALYTFLFSMQCMVPVVMVLLEVSDPAKTRRKASSARSMNGRMSLEIAWSEDDFPALKLRRE